MCKKMNERRIFSSLAWKKKITQRSFLQKDSIIKVNMNISLDEVYQPTYV